MEFKFHQNYWNWLNHENLFSKIQFSMQNLMYKMVIFFRHILIQMKRYIPFMSTISKLILLVILEKRERWNATLFRLYEVNIYLQSSLCKEIVSFISNTFCYQDFWHFFNSFVLYCMFHYFSIFFTNPSNGLKLIILEALETWSFVGWKFEKHILKKYKFSLA